MPSMLGSNASPARGRPVPDLQASASAWRHHQTLLQAPKPRVHTHASPRTANLRVEVPAPARVSAISATAAVVQTAVVTDTPSYGLMGSRQAVTAR